jgi:hypothetical protein
MMSAKQDEPVEALLQDHIAILDQLVSNGEASFAATLQQTIPKVGLLAAASWMEFRVMEILREFFHEVTGGTEEAIEFVRINALERKYHTLFDWQKRTVAAFLAKFGPDLKSYGRSIAETDPDFSRQASAFMELGELRNQLVHGNYAAFTLEKTTAEVLTLYRDAAGFVDCLPRVLRKKFGEND